MFLSIFISQCNASCKGTKEKKSSKAKLRIFSGNVSLDFSIPYVIIQHASKYLSLILFSFTCSSKLTTLFTERV